MESTMIIECMFCGEKIGVKDGLGNFGTTTSICPLCLRKHYPRYAKQLLPKKQSATKG